MNLSNDTVKKILVVRTDRIGDVVLSLPMLPIIKKHFPQASISMMVRPYTKELVESHSCVSEVILWEDSKSNAEYVRILRQKKFDIAIMPYPRFNLALIAFLARIPIRAGTGYRWYSFLFNKKIYDHRKNAQRHEVEYNLRLLSAIDIQSDELPAFEFSITKVERLRVTSILTADAVKRFAVLHVGSGGSARDWSIDNFAALGDKLKQQHNLSIVLTGGKNDSDIVSSVVSKMKTVPFNYSGKFSLRELGALFQKAAVFVSNSTGPLHIASMVNTPVVAFYPPIIQCSATRWGPYTKRKRVYTADNATCVLCRGGQCSSNVCMDQITVDQVASGIAELLDEKD